VKKYCARGTALAFMLAVAYSSGSAGQGSPAGGIEAPIPGLAGLWKGTSGNRIITALVLDDGTFYLLYSVSNSTLLGGFKQGAATTVNGRFASIDAVDFNAQAGVAAVQVAAPMLARSLRACRCRASRSRAGGACRVRWARGRRHRHHHEQSIWIACPTGARISRQGFRAST
jgi:hypothetical protein